MNDPFSDQPSRNNIDLLRLAFAALVLISHAPELIDGTREHEVLSKLTNGVSSFGEVGLNGFFALSGYLIVASWVRHPRLIPYFRNRILRIYPAFVLAFCISVLVVGPLGSARASYFSQFDANRFLASMLFLQNPSFVRSFEGQPWPFVNGALWSIAYEFSCYVAVAIVGVLAAHRLRAVWIALTIALLAFSCLLPEMRHLPRIGPFGVGEFIRLSAIFFAGGSLFLVGFRGVHHLPLLAAIGVAFVGSLFSERYVVFGFALFGTPFLLSLGLGRRKFGARRKLPDISYGTYLYGWPIQKLVHWYGPDLGVAELTVVSLVLALICGYLSWNGLEEKFMRLKVRRTTPPLSAVANLTQ